MTERLSTSGLAGTGSAAGDRLPPARFAYDRHTWKEIAHLLANFPAALLGFTYVVTMLSVGIGLTVTVIGLPLLAAGLLGARQLGKLERARTRALLGVRVDEPSPLPLRSGRGFFAQLWMSLKDPVGWRTVLYAFIRFPWGVATFVVTLTSLFVLWPVLPFIARGLANADRAMVRGLLSPSDELERRIAELESDRGIVVDTAAADLRRIERDLHDGAQARLVNLAMGLGLAKEKLLEDPDAAAAMVDEAHGEVKLALQELRDLARGIHPAVLTDRGLDAALSSVASRCTVPVKVTADLTERPAAAIEGIAYFTVSELLQNVSKHSGASSASVEVWRSSDRLLIQVEDNGHGGARLDGGTGMKGLADRLSAVDGLFVVDSPEGGPTTITAELPWRDRTGADAAGSRPRG
ncbi:MULTISPECIES: sensor histidine kinase [Streptomyces]|uniref:histidine kinase n=1 Tax=Streptomyces coelicolor (strain ATCC BAA-471 / A3(2) / M145) TaxID=100226 RepID=Q9F2W3_STRCO|nr:MULTISPECIES: sensor domain-containing protein [Streptomyces]MDX2929787.1 sensor domain-containing protein [Streptomyces sp. NRRL_B-16638]MYU44118.1 sensor histidine kinase [Streptomyces sp. SID7813]NSL81576.1 sensor histidine kinase [Streptomyces coelicolor]QFI44535.1 sensor histidine kinase [Streptomyces coelicolor A3(2)]QKN68164.1 sensor histidine kinase [Streptomyces coelicolor]